MDCGSPPANVFRFFGESFSAMTFEPHDTKSVARNVPVAWVCLLAAGNVPDVSREFSVGFEAFTFEKSESFMASFITSAEKNPDVFCLGLPMVAEIDFIVSESALPKLALNSTSVPPSAFAVRLILLEQLANPKIAVKNMNVQCILSCVSCLINNPGFIFVTIFFYSSSECDVCPAFSSVSERFSDSWLSVS